MDTDSFVRRLVERGRLAESTAGWVLDAFARVRPAVDAASRFRRFVHNDVQPDNVMVTPDGRAVLIDWGDAAWSEATRDLNDLVPRSIPHVLAGYREVMPFDDDDTVEARVLHDHLYGALWYLDRPATPRAGEWSRATGARLVELLAEATSPTSWVRRALLDQP